MKHEVMWCDPAAEHFFRREFDTLAEAEAAAKVPSLYYVCRVKPSVHPKGNGNG